MVKSGSDTVRNYLYKFICIVHFLSGGCAMVSRTAKMERTRKIARREDAMQRKTADHLFPFLYKNIFDIYFKKFCFNTVASFLDKAKQIS
jgi:hypothetical protein